MDLDPAASHARFEVELNVGDTMLQAWLARPDGNESGAYDVQVRDLVAR